MYSLTLHFGSLYWAGNYLSSPFPDGTSEVREMKPLAQWGMVRKQWKSFIHPRCFCLILLTAWGSEGWYSSEEIWQKLLSQEVTEQEKAWNFAPNYVLFNLAFPVANKAKLSAEVLPLGSHQEFWLLIWADHFGQVVQPPYSHLPIYKSEIIIAFQWPFFFWTGLHHLFSLICFVWVGRKLFSASSQ